MKRRKTQTLFGDDARRKIQAGADTLQRTVVTTLGPKGYNVGADLGHEAWVKHDGVEVARQIHPTDPFENFAVRILREAANRQVEAVGDGTTVTILLAHAILSEANKRIAAGVNGQQLRRELETALASLIDQLQTRAIKVEDVKQAIQVATISAEDADLGELVGKTVYDHFNGGIVTVEEHKGADTYVELQQGMQWDRGFISPYFITDESRNEATVDHAHILITDHSVFNILDLAPLLESMSKRGMDRLVVIAPEVTDSALQTLVANKVQGTAQVLAAYPPGSGTNQTHMLDDIAILTEGTVISQAKGMSLKDATLEHLGQAERVTSTKNATLIVGGAGEAEAVKERIAALKEQHKLADSQFDRQKLNERIGRLAGSVAVIKVGGQTEIEMKERKERVIDAVAATQACMRGGIVAGGETVYLDLQTDNIIFDRALYAPFAKLMTNAGYDPGRKITQLTVGKTVIDATTGEPVDAMQTGIIDPVEVPINALRNATSVAIQLFTTDAVVVNVEETDGVSKLPQSGS